MGAVVLILASLIFIVNAAFILGQIKQPQTVGTANAVVGVLIMTVSILNGIAATDAGGLINAGLGMSFSLFYLILVREDRDGQTSGVPVIMPMVELGS